MAYTELMYKHFKKSVLLVSLVLFFLVMTLQFPQKLIHNVLIKCLNIMMTMKEIMRCFWDIL